MGQRNEKSVEELKNKAMEKREEYKEELLDTDDPETEEVLGQKIQKCENCIEFCRWQLGQRLRLEL